MQAHDAQFLTLLGLARLNSSETTKAQSSAAEARSRSTARSQASREAKAFVLSVSKEASTYSDTDLTSNKQHLIWTTQANLIILQKITLQCVLQ